MSSGELWYPLREDVMFSIPSFTPADLASRCGIQEISTSRVELQARIELLKRLRELDRAVEDAYNLVCQRAGDVYAAVRSPHPDQWASTTVSEVARLSAAKPDTITLLATHKYLMSSPVHFLAHNDYQNTHSFDVRPQSEVEIMETLQSWIRLPEGPVDSFALKAQDVIKQTQGIREASRAEPPSQISARHTWSEDDKCILNFLLQSLRPHRTTQADPYSIGQSAILKCINPRGPPVNDYEVHKVLMDLGVLSSWQDLVVLRPDLNLDPEEEGTSLRVKDQDALVARGFLTPAARSHGPLGPEDFYPTDPLESVRHDFGDLPVFVIDDASAEELDDGVSLERIPSEPGNTWLHVHIADPGSVLPPTHTLAKEALKMSESKYFLQRSWPLFPRSLMHAPGHGLSLGSKPDLPDRVLTFSIKLDAAGEIIDYRVRAGLIHNVRKYSYDAVDRGLGVPPTACTYPFGGKPQELPLTSIPDAHLKDLRELYGITHRCVKRRLADGIFNHSEFKATITGHFPATRPTLTPTHFRGFPELGYAVTSTHDEDVGARSLVAESMKLACRISSRFCLEHDVPVLRRGSGPFQTATDSDYQKILDHRTPNGYVLYEKSLPYITLSPSAGYSLEPKAHFGVGVAEGEGYVRTTSPLRRYSDLLSHWQIHHALLGSAAPTKSPPFSREWLQDYATKLKGQEQLWKGAQRIHDRFWTLAYINRWREATSQGIEHRHDPLKNLHGHTLGIPKVNFDTRKYQVEVQIPTLGVHAFLEDLDSSSLAPGTAVPLEILELRLGTRPQLRVHMRNA